MLSTRPTRRLGVRRLLLPAAVAGHGRPAAAGHPAEDDGNDDPHSQRGRSHGGCRACRVDLMGRAHCAAVRVDSGRCASTVGGPVLLEDRGVLHQHQSVVQGVSVVPAVPCRRLLVLLHQHLGTAVSHVLATHRRQRPSHPLVLQVVRPIRADHPVLEIHLRVHVQGVLIGDDVRVALEGIQVVGQPLLAGPRHGELARGALGPGAHHAVGPVLLPLLLLEPHCGSGSAESALGVPGKQHRARGVRVAAGGQHVPDDGLDNRPESLLAQPVLILRRQINSISQRASMALGQPVGTETKIAP
mmetsp:Transcript_54323/g.144958  ORF Transcript_54323/g.144958 Transcript_54323/m.144958 type:complete len:301 (-) Transcript_54323:849-1751(-)